MPDVAVTDLEARPWDPIPREPGTSFAGLTLYRETPPDRRNLRDVARRLGKSLSIVERHSSRWRWIERTRAWDVAQAKERDARTREVESDWVRRHADAGKRLQALGLAGLGQVLERDAEGNVHGLKKLRPQDFIRMITAGSMLEQTAALHATGTLELEFVQQLVDVFAAVFVEANRCEKASEREKSFRAGCARALQELIS